MTGISLPERVRWTRQLPRSLQHALGRVEQHLGRRSAQRDQHFGVGQLDLPLDERPADLGLLRRRRAVARRPPRDDVGDVGRRCGRCRSPPGCGRAAGRSGRRRAGPRCPRRGPAPRRPASAGHPDCRRQTPAIFAVNLRLQPSKPAMLWRSSSRVVARAASSRASRIWPSSGTDAASGAARGAPRSSMPEAAGVRDGGELAGWAEAARSWSTAGAAAGARAANSAKRSTGLLLDRFVDAGLGVEFEQFANVCGQPIQNLVKTRRAAFAKLRRRGCADPGRYRIASAG